MITPFGPAAALGAGGGLAGAWGSGRRVALTPVPGGRALSSRMVWAVRPEREGGPGVRAWVGCPEGGNAAGAGTPTGPGAASPGRRNSISTPPTCKRVPLASSAWATSWPSTRIPLVDPVSLTT